MTKLNKNNVEKIKQSYNDLDKNFHKRIDYIVKTIGKTLKVRINYDFDDTRGSIIDTYHDTAGQIFIWLTTRSYARPLELNIILDGQEVDLTNYIPAKWLFEDFEKELEAGYNLFKEKRKLSKNSESKLVKSAKAKLTKAKLTKEELKILGLDKDARKNKT